VLPSLINGVSAKAFGLNPFMERDEDPAVQTDHVLVLVRMDGGNDGLNTVIPLEIYDTLANVRPQVIMPRSSLLSLSGNSSFALHPSLTGFQSLYNGGKLKIINSVGYPTPNFSHFRSSDIWLSGSDSEQVVTNGWIGRYLGNEYPNFPVGYPNPTMPDPLAIELGSSTTLTSQGTLTNMGVAITDTQAFYDLLNGVQTPTPNTFAGEQLNYVRLVYDQSRKYGTVILNAASNVTTQAPYPANNYLAEQLKIVARLIAGGLKTRVYSVSLSGFDTHSAQVMASDHTKGTHAELLKQVGDAIKAFTEDCAFLRIQNRVIGLCHSEFGRRIKSNNSGGSDHGTAAPVFVFGAPVTGGIVGSTPTLPGTVTVEDNLIMQYDYRSLYTSLLKDWFCVSQNDLRGIMFRDFQSIPLVTNPNCTSATHEANQLAGKELISNYPNPFTESTNIKFETDGSFSMIQIFNLSGQIIATPHAGILPAGEHVINWDSQDLPSGNYYARYQNGDLSQVRAMIKVK
jgi:uncharacterized protein (DUF1501 family)